MKFETKLERLGIDENEVKSIIMNCECGEINGAYFIDLTKMRKWEIMETIGNYLDPRDASIDWMNIKRISTFCKVFEISENRIREFFVQAFNEDGCDIAYELESNKDVILVLTDDERYTNSFIQYSPSQEEIEQYTKELEELEKEYIRLGELKPVKEPLTIFDEPATKVNCEIHIRRKGAKYQCRYHDIQKLTQDEIEFINSRNTSQNIIKKLEILRDAEIGDDMSADEQEWFSFGRGSNILVINELIDELREIEKENGKISISKNWKHYITIKAREDATSSSSSKTIENEVENIVTEENWVNFKIVSKNDERIYIAGQFDVNSYDEDTDMGDWEYEQNDGTMASHLPRYWKVNGENLSFEYEQFIDSIDWEIFRQYLFDFADENKSIDMGTYFLHINEGATVEINIEEEAGFGVMHHIAKLTFNYNRQPIEFDKDILTDLRKELIFDEDGFNINDGWSSVRIIVPRFFDDGESIDEQDEIIQEWIEEVKQAFARQLSRDAGIYTYYGENIEQLVEYDIASDMEQMFLFNSAVSRNCVKDWMVENTYLEE